MRRPTASRARPRLTGRAAVLAVVICAITLSLAYPVREYIAQHRQISALAAQQRSLTDQLGQLHHRQQQLNDPAYIEQLARDELHLCMPKQTCYVIINGKPAPGLIQPKVPAPSAWYDRLWQSVQQADQVSKKKTH